MERFVLLRACHSERERKKNPLLLLLLPFSLPFNGFVNGDGMRRNIAALSVPISSLA